MVVVVPVTHLVPIHVRLALIVKLKSKKGRHRRWQGYGQNGVRVETKNLALKKVMEEYPPQEISFEWKDKRCIFMSGRIMCGGVTMSTSWSGSYRCTTLPSRISTSQRRRTSMEDLCSSRWTEIEKGIEQHSAKRYSNNKHNLKRDYWNVKPGETHDVEAIRSRPPPSVEQSEWDKPIKFWLDPKHVTRAAKDVENRARDTIFCCYGCRSLAVLRGRDDHAEGSWSRYAYGCDLHRGADTYHGKKG
nr:hypothetical protein [Tanacetum cinerariifolium]